MLLSDRDILAEVAAHRVVLAPWDVELLQPSSIDVRLDRYFRVFNNSQYTHIDPAEQQDELTTLVEPNGEEPFVLHPGEFVLGSTLEIVQPGPARLAHPLDRGLHRPRLHRPHHPRTEQRGEPADNPVAGDEDRPALPVPAVQCRRAPVRLGGVRLALSGPARPHPEPLAPQLPTVAHQLNRLWFACRPTPGWRTTILNPSASARLS